MTTPNTLNSRALELALEFAGNNPVEEPWIEVELWARAPVKCSGKEFSLSYSLKFTTASRMDMKGNIEKVEVRVQIREVEYMLSTEFAEELGDGWDKFIYPGLAHANVTVDDDSHAYVSRFKDQSEVKAWAEDIVQAYFKCLVIYLKGKTRAKQKGENK